jgi:hypothetical protein
LPVIATAGLIAHEQAMRRRLQAFGVPAMMDVQILPPPDASQCGPIKVQDKGMMLQIKVLIIAVWSGDFTEN